MNRVLHLKSGGKLTLSDVDSVEFTASALTEKTLHKFETDCGHYVFVQGDNIAYIEVWPK